FPPRRGANGSTREAWSNTPKGCAQVGLQTRASGDPACSGTGMLGTLTIGRGSRRGYGTFGKTLVKIPTPWQSMSQISVPGSFVGSPRNPAKTSELEGGCRLSKIDVREFSYLVEVRQ